MSEQQNVTKMFIPKMRFVVGLASFLLVGSLSSYAYGQSKTQQLTQKDYSPQNINNASLNSLKTSTVPQQQSLTNSILTLNSNFSIPTLS